ncbi:Uncharacterised protein [Bordetella pertussis]|nr:Uncharacterised protein [Bordetella pertussis]
MYFRPASHCLPRIGTQRLPLLSVPAMGVNDSL